MHALILAIALGQAEFPTLSPIKPSRTVSNAAPTYPTAELERISQRYPYSVRHTDAHGRTWAKVNGRWKQHYQSVVRRPMPAAPRSARPFRPQTTRPNVDLFWKGFGFSFSTNARACST